MGKNLVIVESPSKSKTIEKYLGKDYKVLSSKGHIRDLATSGKYGLGVDVENNFEPNYKNLKDKSKVIKTLKDEAVKAEKIYLASDPDREGEAISFHLKEVLELDDNSYDRVIFNEITKDKVIEAFTKPRKIDSNLVESQETRRILDRIIGFRLSKLMQSKTNGKSAGRVQSVALKLIVDREREIEAFVPEEYWEIDGIFNDFEAKLEKFKDAKIKIKNEKETNDILSKLSKAFTIENVEYKEGVRRSKVPFITSTLQQMAYNKLNFSSRKTMMIAQKLYEGIELENETEGLITYMRTDSTRLSSEFISKALHYIEGKYGKEYVGVPKQKKKKDQNIQDAHEAIRPTNVNRNPESVKKFLSEDEYKLYRLIYFRTIASLMKDAKVNKTAVIFDNNDYKFKATGQVITFEGYLKVFKEYEDTSDKFLPEFEKYNSNVIVSNEIKSSQHFTKPVARYTESKLIKEMEELGIGRPSTYSSTVETLKNRGYVNLVEKKFEPTEIGINMTDKLQEFFNGIINVKYTADMESSLDLIAEGKKDEVKVLKDFYGEFSDLIDKAFLNMEDKKVEKTGEKCPECGSDLVYRVGKYGKFVGCENYPECKYIKQDEVKEVIDCPNCDGKIVEKRTRRGKVFYGCNNFPKCKTAFWDKPIGEKCPECGEELVEKKGKVSCYSCDYKKE